MTARSRRLAATGMLMLFAFMLLAAHSVSATASQRAAPITPRLVDIRASHRTTHDRVVFDFAGGLPSRVSVHYVNRLLGAGSGLPVSIAGRAILEVTFHPAVAHNAAGRNTAPVRVAYGLPNVITAVRSGDFEGYVSYGIGLAKATHFHVFTLRHPDRVVIDIATPFRTVLKRVYFFNPRRFAANTEPFFTSVLRPVLATSPAVGVLDRLFAGPTPSEAARGLSLLSSRATGYSGLTIRAGIARLRLTGGCSSGGSTATIAEEIFPTLKQFRSVSFVKLYDPKGHTEHPSGRSDSIPFCLEP